ncbi:hypothetical protein [Acinetobacter sp. ANC 3813]|uniref:hypothetical protein n=1 Tax=Acinetobacter sp. ANC 3813 TaxID=1977873 RepID=UPI00111C6372|nr:hypothetical protein [Acinetobacter sp. ANC 3813]
MNVTYTKEQYDQFIDAIRSKAYVGFGLHICNLNWRALHHKEHSLEDIKQADKEFIERVYNFLDQLADYIELERRTIIDVFLLICLDLENNFYRKMLISRIMPACSFGELQQTSLEIQILNFSLVNGLDPSGELEYKGHKLSKKGFKELLEDYSFSAK